MAILVWTTLGNYCIGNDNDVSNILYDMEARESTAEMEEIYCGRSYVTNYTEESFGNGRQ